MTNTKRNIRKKNSLPITGDKKYFEFKPYLISFVAYTQILEKDKLK